MAKIINSLRNFRDRIRTGVNIKTRNVLFFTAICLVIILAIFLRITPIFRGPRLIKAFDPWIQWYNAEYLSDHSLYEYFNWRDYKSWYPEGYNRGSLRPGLTFTVVIIQKIITFFGVQVSLYDICYFFPAIMGGITVLVAYFLGKELLDRGTGLLAAFFLAFNPGYAQRTMAGFFDNETIGVFAVLMTFLFLLKAMRTGKFFHAMIGGLSLGYLSLSWGGYQFVFLVIPILCIILIFSEKYNQNILIAYAGVEGAGLLIFSLFSRFKYDALFSDIELGGIFLFTIILIAFHIIQRRKIDHPVSYQRLINFIKWGFIPAVVIVAGIVWVAPDIIPFGFGSRFQTILNPLLRDEVSLVASVAEQMPSPWSVFYYNSLIPLVLTPLGTYFCFKRLNAPEVFLIVFVILMFYFTGSMIRIILIFAPAVSLMGAYGLVSVLRIFGSFLGERKVGVSRKRRRQVRGTVGSAEAIVIVLVVGFLGIAQVVHATDISIDQLSYSQISPGGVIHDWEETLTWMRSNLEGTDVVVSWWDYGYWLTPIGNVTTVNDNATANQTRIGLTGMALMQTDEIYSAKAFRRLRADYVLVYFGLFISGLGGDEGKWPWMVRIPNDNYANYKRLGWEEDNWAEDAIFIEDEYQNTTSGLMGAKWFQSQLVRLMFALVPTNPDELDPSDIRYRYATQINTQRTQDGSLWKDHIPDNGLYNFKIFSPAYISRFGLVKLYKIDYTVLDSSFFISEAEVIEDGYATFKLKNTGTKDLLIKEVQVNGVSYDFSMGKGAANNMINNSDTDIVWVDLDGASLQKDDVVKIDVTAESEAQAGNKYEFSNSTANFFVKQAEQGEIMINKEHSLVLQNNATSNDIFLEVKNTGETVEKLDRFYLNEDTVENELNPDNIHYLEGSPILEPGDIVTVQITDVEANFFPIRNYNKIGVATPSGISSEALFTSSKENYSISILGQERILSPEVLAALSSTYRNHIPINFNKTHALTFENGSTIIRINVKNTGDIIFGIDSVYLTESLTEVDFEDFYTESGSYNLDTNEEDFIVVNATNYIDSVVNEEILICVTGSFGTTVTSDIGYIHTIKDQPDIQIIENIEGVTTSFIYANETGKLLIKNTGDQQITLDQVYLNSTLATNITYLYGNPSLGVQECAIIQFDIPGLVINKSDDVIINVTTTSTAKTGEIFDAYVDPLYYNIEIDDPGTSVFNSGNMTISFTNLGQQNVTLASIYVNNTFISLPNLYTFFNNSWVPLTSSYMEAFNIGIGDSMDITIRVNDLEIIMGTTINVDDEVAILVRTEEGAEIIHSEIVK